MNPSRLRRRVVQLVAAVSIGLGLVLLGAGAAAAQANEAVWGAAAVSNGPDTSGVSIEDGSSPVLTALEAVWG
jgi:uncharacterized membrane protein HdeD (DUF308 family)